MGSLHASVLHKTTPYDQTQNTWLFDAHIADKTCKLSDWHAASFVQVQEPCHDYMGGVNLEMANNFHRQAMEGF